MDALLFLKSYFCCKSASMVALCSSRVGEFDNNLIKFFRKHSKLAIQFVRIRYFLQKAESCQH